LNTVTGTDTTMSASTQCGKGKVGGTYKKRLEQENTATHVVCETVNFCRRCA